MSKIISTTVERTATRTGTTIYGNPIYVMHTTDGDFRIGDNNSANYEATNFRTGDRVTFTLTRAGRIEAIGHC